LVELLIKLEEFLRIVGEVFPNQPGIDKGEKQYEDCITHREMWDNLSNIKPAQVKDVVVNFLNQWQCRLPYDCVPYLTTTLQRAERLLQPLRGFGIEYVDLFKPVKVEEKEIRVISLVENLFATIQKVRAGRRTVGFTATSKILHMAVPNLFVMCDERIRKKYGCEGNSAGYANFMFWMSFFARDLISQAKEDKQRILGCSKWKNRTLPRLLDNYNYTKYTLKKE
jgi:hypothetical protein